MDIFDAIIVGGGPAGLQAALTLGRMHRTAVLVDSGEYRNAAVLHAHNTLGLDGVAPAEIRRRAREEISAYPTVQIREARVAGIDGDGETGFVVRVKGDDGPLRARNVVLATGLADELPALPGIAEAWGDRVAHCPFCHGHEFAGRAIAILGTLPHAAMQQAMLRPIASEVTVVDPAEVAAVEPIADGLRVVRTAGDPLDVAGVFVAPASRQRAPFAAQLGLALQESGAVAIDAFGRTSRDGVFAAGDAAHSDAFPGPMATIALAVAAGQLAAVAIVQRVVAADLSAAA